MGKEGVRNQPPEPDLQIKCPSSHPHLLGTCSDMTTLPRHQHLPLQTVSSSKRQSPILLPSESQRPRCSGDAGLLFRQKMLYLQHHLKLDTTKALTLNPNIRSTPISTLQSTETCLLSFGIPPSHFRRIFGMYPILLTSSPHAYLYPVFDFLLNEAHIPFPLLPKSICRCPRLLVSSVPLQLRPTLHFLRRLGFGGDRRAISSLITTLLVSSVDSTLIPKLDYIQSLGFSYDDTVHMVRRSPGLLTFSIQNNFRPKVDYFVNHMNGDIQQLKDFPHYFAFSLQDKIIPRHRLLLEYGFSMCLEEMLTVSDGKFGERLIDMRLQMLEKSISV